MLNSHFDLDNFIAKILGRTNSFFAEDLANNKPVIAEKLLNKSILVIGGAGTIGSFFIKALLRFGQPAKLVVVDTNENGLTELVRDIRSSTGFFIPETFITYPVDFSNDVFYKILKNEGPFEIVANFAAHKHVRSEKDMYAIEAMIRNNLLNAAKLLDVLSANPPENFFCVSTDKAANPVNIMGASKKLMEDLILSYSEEFPVSTARFANVAFSNGSLPFGFLERLSKKQPLSAPKNIKRFFVSPSEAGELCMLAGLLGKNGEIFFPKLDADKHMNTFTFIGNELLAELGYKPRECNSEEEARHMAQSLNKDSKEYPVYYFNSDTTGEKPYEEFYTEKESPDFNKFNSLGVIKNQHKQSRKKIYDIIDELNKIFLNNNTNKADIVSLLSKHISGFEHVEMGKSLDQKM